MKCMCSDPIWRNYKMLKCNRIHSFDALWLPGYFGFWFQHLLFLFCFKFYAIDWQLYMEITAAGFRYKTCFILRYFAFISISRFRGYKLTRCETKVTKIRIFLYCHKRICSQQTVFPYGEFDGIKILSSAEKNICYALFVTSPFTYNLDI